MKKMHRRLFFTAALLGVLGFSLSSFTPSWGGDSFTVHLNNKLILEQYLYRDKAVKTIDLQTANSNDELRISFSHCGVVGKSRVLAIKDQNNHILKQWNYEDSKGSMSCKVKDILGLEKGNTTLQLFYSSSEMPKGLVLATIAAENVGTVKK